MNDADVIVLDIDGGAMLQSCVDALLHQSLEPRRIVVFDNGSRTPVSVRLTGDVEVIRSETNLGFAAANNEALRKAGAPLVALVNNDVIADAEWLRTLVDAFEADAKLGAAQAIIRRNDSTIDGAGIDISDGTIRQIGHGMPVGAPLPGAWGVSATATVYRRAAIGERFFDPRFFAYYEDVELCARLHESGWTTRVLPIALATHRGSHSASVLGPDALRLRTRNRYFVARMHPGVGRISALLREDAKLLLRGRSSLRGIWEGLTTSIR
jgi:N-acetylglucosaminyl-diphospho-decaprenol L-rhamnosyltransferase